MSTQQTSLSDIQQGTPEWFSIRKTKITATDAGVILGVNHWKTRIQLYHEKLSDYSDISVNDKMQRGIDLEPIARDFFILKTGIIVYPKVVIKDWVMASLDGINDRGNCIVEIKCPGEKDHSEAILGRVPSHYYPQLQHQMYVADVDEMYYFSFDGEDGVIVTVKRDQEYIDRMIKEEKIFYECLINKIPPQPSENDYIERNDDLWQQCALKWKSITNSIKELEKEEEDLRKQLIFLSGESNTKGAGISLCQVQRKGNVDYSKIPHLKGLDLETFRKESINSWRITCQ